MALSISTVKELKLFDEGSWVAHVSRVKWNQQEAGKAEVFYRTDLLRMAKAGDLEHIPGKAEIDKVYFKTACPLPILSIRERLQELRLDIESDLSADVLAMCKWPGRDVIDSINLNAPDTDVLMRINRIEEKHLSCFRMLKRMIKPKPPEQQPKPVSDKAGNTKRKKARKKTPRQFLKEARERQAAQELAKDPNLTAKKLGEILECDKSTVVRLKAWKKKNVLNNPLPKGFIKRTEDENYSTVEAINEPE